ncbi:MAG TPA: hypothetical protein PKJ53_06675 [Spirochaetales bacterium]|nr:hypothetical protein [Spirochaetales bacterium]
MRKNKFPSLVTLGILIILSATLSLSCNNAFGVFHEIQTEKPQEGTDTFLKVSVKALAEDETNYYAAMAKIFYRPKATDNSSSTDGTVLKTWKLLEVNGESDYFCSGMVSDGRETLYVASSTIESGTLNGIYSTTDAGTTWSNLIAPSDDTFSNSHVDALFFAGDYLFVSAHSIGTAGNDLYALYYYDGESFKPAGLDMTGLPYCITDLAYDGSKYWAINQEKVFVGSVGPDGISFAADATSGTPKADADKSLTGLFVDSNKKVHVTTYNDYLYTYTSTGWSSRSVSESGLNSPSIHLGKLIEIIKGPSDATLPRLLIANTSSTTSYGYYEYPHEDSSTTIQAVAGANGIVAGGSSTYNSTVRGKPVNVFYISRDNTVLFVGLSSSDSSSYSLYSSTYSSAEGKWSGWSAE